MKVFLGGTCNESTWRNKFVSYIDENIFSWFDPVVDDWNNTAQSNELRERKTCDFCLYTITPKMTGSYAIAEVIDDSNKRPKKTVFVLLRDDDNLRFTESQWKSLVSVASMVARNGGQVFEDLKSAAIWMAKSKV